MNLDEVPDYTEFIKHPMDLETMEKKLESRKSYRTKTDFTRDVYLIFENAKTYNKSSTIYYRYALNLEEYIKPHLEHMTEPSDIELQEYDKLELLKQVHGNKHVKTKEVDAQ